MAILENIKKYLAVKSIQKVLANQDRESHYPDFSSTKSLLILFESEENEKNKFIRSIVSDLKNQGKKVTVWGYLDKKVTETAVLPDFRLFCNSELNFFKIPKPLLTEEFIQVPLGRTKKILKDCKQFTLDEFKDFPPHIIIDDASHLIEDQLKMIEICYSQLQAGGYLIIEDIQDI